jgi:hypothetical protein
VSVTGCRSCDALAPERCARHGGTAYVVRDTIPPAPVVRDMRREFPRATPHTGWQCPRCLAVFAPSVARCPDCGPAPRKR